MYACNAGVVVVSPTYQHIVCPIVSDNTFNLDLLAYHYGLGVIFVIGSPGPQKGRHGGFMVNALDFGASGPGSTLDREHCVVFMGKTLYSYGASLHPGI